MIAICMKLEVERSFSNCFTDYYIYINILLLYKYRSPATNVYSVSRVHCARGSAYDALFNTV